MNEYIKIKKLEEGRTRSCNCCLSEKDLYIIDFWHKSGRQAIQVCLCEDCLNELKESLDSYTNKRGNR